MFFARSADTGRYLLVLLDTKRLTLRDRYVGADISSPSKRRAASSRTSKVCWAQRDVEPKATVVLQTTTDTRTASEEPRLIQDAQAQTGAGRILLLMGNSRYAWCMACERAGLSTCIFDGASQLEQHASNSYCGGFRLEFDHNLTSSSERPISDSLLRSFDRRITKDCKFSNTAAKHRSRRNLPSQDEQLMQKSHEWE